MDRERIFANSEVAAYLEERKEELLKGRKEESVRDWYLYGRTQALRDVWKKKYAINTIIKDEGSIKLNVVPRGCGVYSGLYMLTDVEEEVIRRIVVSREFVEYVASLKKYKSGGYYTFNSAELETFLNYKISMYFNDKKYVRQQSLFEDNRAVV